MKHKNIEVGMTIQNKETGEIYLVLSNEIDYFRLDGNYINSNSLNINVIVDKGDAKLFRKVKR